MWPPSAYRPGRSRSQAGSVVSLTDRLNATLSVRRGFLAANAADLGSIGLTGGGGFEITPSRAAALGGLVGTSTGSSALSTGTPVSALGPEVLYASELGLKFRSGRFDAAIIGYVLEFFDSIQRRAVIFPTDVAGTSIAGFDLMNQDGSGLAYIAQDIRPVVTRVNVDRARIVGGEVSADARITRGVTAAAFLSITNGRLLTTGEHMRRLPPPSEARGCGGARKQDGSRAS